MGKVTINDVALKVGVSPGTVDRVLHNRGRFSAETASRVREAVSALGYEPNVHASALAASKKSYRVLCMIPSVDSGQYWEKVQDGFLRGISSVSNLNISGEIRPYNQYDEQSFVDVACAVIAEKPSAVILHPLFREAARRFTSDLRTQGIPYAFIDNKLDDPAAVAYFGVDYYASGYLSAHLLTDGGAGDVLMVRLIRDKKNLADPTLLRRRGFLDYMQEHYPEKKVHTLFISPVDAAQRNRSMEDFFEKHPAVKHIVVTNSRSHLLSDFLLTHPCRGRRVVGFDDLPLNLSALESGCVDYLVTRHIDMQSYYAVQALSEYLVRGKKPAHQDNRMHLDILTRLNLKDYE